MIDVLLYLFENYIKYDANLLQDAGSIAVELEKAGFEEGDIDRAFVWLEGLVQIDPAHFDFHNASLAVRHYTYEECQKIPLDCQGYLLFLEQAGIVTPVLRELIIDRTMALDIPEVSLERLKWVLLLVLFSEPSQENTLNLVRDLVFPSTPEIPH